MPRDIMWKELSTRPWGGRKAYGKDDSSDDFSGKEL